MVFCEEIVEESVAAIGLTKRVSPSDPVRVPKVPIHPVQSHPRHLRQHVSLERRIGDDLAFV